MSYIVTYCVTLDIDADSDMEALDKAEKEIKGMTLEEDARIYVDGKLYY